MDFPNQKFYIMDQENFKRPSLYLFYELISRFRTPVIIINIPRVFWGEIFSLKKILPKTTDKIWPKLLFMDSMIETNVNFIAKNCSIVAVVPIATVININNLFFFITGKSFCIEFL